MQKVRYFALAAVLLAALLCEHAWAQTPALFNWTGYYVGVHAGYSWGQERSVNSTGDSHLIQGDGAALGLHGGRNWQAGSWIYGFEGDINVLGPKLFENFANVNITDERLDFFGSIRARFGYASNDYLFFVTGGYAFAQFDQSLNLRTLPGGARTFANADDFIHGFVVGAGVERAFSRNWNMRLEYQFTAYQHHFDSIITAPIVRATAPRDMNLEIHFIRIGVSYRFGAL